MDEQRAEESDLAAGADSNAESDGGTALARQVMTLLDALPLAVLEIGHGGQRIERVNPRLCTLVGLDAEDLVGSRAPFPWLAPGQHEALQALLAEADQHSSVRRRMILRTADGSDVVTIAAATTLTSPGRPSRVVLVLEGLEGVERVLVPDIERARFLLELANERDRIARDLHDRVIQRLFAVGVDLEVSAELMAGGANVHDRLWHAVEEIDAAMTEIRRTIFVLHRPGPSGARPFELLQSTVEAAGRLLGRHPELLVIGPLSSVPAELIDEMTAVVRELLTNVAKHADASTSWVKVALTDGWVVVTVEDDGVGPEVVEGDHGGTGLRSLTERATRLGGRLSIEPRALGGTTVSWRIPLGTVDDWAHESETGSDRP